MTPERRKTIDDLKLKYFSPEVDRNIDWDVVDLVSLQKLDRAREIAGVPIFITSNHRSPAQGAHSEEPCTAFDIRCGRPDGKWNSQLAYKVIPALCIVGFNRIGVNNKNNHIHADRSTVLPQNVFFIE